MSTRSYPGDYRSILPTLPLHQELTYAAAIAVDLSVIARRKHSATRAYATVSAARAPPAYDISVRVMFRHPMYESRTHDYHANVLTNLTPVVASIFEAVPPSGWFDDLADGSAPAHLPWRTKCADSYHLASVSLRPEVGMPPFSDLALELIQACSTVGPIHQISYKPLNARRWHQLLPG